MSARELHARYEVLLEQYTAQLEIEAKTATNMARTLLLPAALRHRARIVDAGGPLVNALLAELDAPLEALFAALTQAPLSLDRLRAAADTLEELVAEDLWPLPSYAEMLFIR